MQTLFTFKQDIYFMLKIFILLRKTTMNNKVKLKQEMMKKKKHYIIYTCVYKNVIKPWLTGKKIMKIKIET